MARRAALTTVLAAALAAASIAAPGVRQDAPDECAELPALLARVERDKRSLDDWARLATYREANESLPPPAKGERRVLFYGDSLTDRWDAPESGGFFPGKGYVNRGRDGQTIPQMLVRFHQDVAALRPSLVVLLAGTNDVASLSMMRRDGTRGSWEGRTGNLERDLASLVDLVRAHGIEVALATIPPVAEYPRTREGVPTDRRPVAAIRAVNAYITRLAAERGLVLVDYYAAMADERGLLRPGLSEDGLHFNAKGYALMAPIAERAIADALARKPARPKITIDDAFSKDGDATAFAGAPAGTTCADVPRLQARIAAHEDVLRDFANRARYADENIAAAARPASERDVVFIGDSITHGWGKPESGGFFPGRAYVNRGISGQTSQQMLVRLGQDVLALRPRAVVILAGTNDIAGVTGPTTQRAIEHNIATMAEVARLNGIRVVLASVPPVGDDDRIRKGDPRMRTASHPPERIAALNRWLASYAYGNDAIYLDYHEALADARGHLKDALTDDGLHPNAAGYAAMAPLAERAIRDALSKPEPFARDVAYGPHERHVLDFWKAPADRPSPIVIFAHGGGFTGGDKGMVPPALVRDALAEGFAVASINYRFADAAPFPGPMRDGVRAIQFLRSKAREWSLDPARFAATGESAGSGMALGAAFHYDLARRDSADPVERQSSRLACVGSMNGQSSYDPRFIEKRIGGSPATYNVFPTFYGVPREEFGTARAHALFEAASPMTYLTRDDPPAFLFFYTADVGTPLPPDAKQGVVIHHPQFGVALKEKMDRLGVRATVRAGLNAAGGGREGWRTEGYGEMVRLFRECFEAIPAVRP